MYTPGAQVKASRLKPLLGFTKDGRQHTMSLETGVTISIGPMMKGTETIRHERTKE